MNCVECGDQTDKTYGLKKDRCGDCYQENPGLRRRVHCVNEPVCKWKGIRQQNGRSFRIPCPWCGAYVIMYDIVMFDQEERILVDMAVMSRVE